MCERLLNDDDDDDDDEDKRETKEKKRGKTKRTPSSSRRIGDDVIFAKTMFWAVLITRTVYEYIV